MIVDLFLVYQFIRRLATPFNEWEAYKLGIIDENGNILKKRKNLTLARERNAFGVFDLLVLNLKKLLAKIPGGSSRLASYAAALYLIREWNHFSDSSMLTEDLSDDTIEESIEVFYDRYVNYIHLGDFVNKKSNINETFEEKFSDSLNELFDKPYQYDLDIRSRSARAVVALPDGTKLKISFTNVARPEGEWDVIFDRGNSIDATGTGDQYKVFSTVISAMDEFIKKAKPEKITFGADKTKSSSRVNLYNKMLKRFAKSVGYDFDSQERFGGVYYTLVKEDAPTVNVGSGAIAGLGVGPQGEPGLTKPQMLRYKKKNKPAKKLRDIIGKAI
jgi:hypothetical protein